MSRVAWLACVLAAGICILVFLAFSKESALETPPPALGEPEVRADSGSREAVEQAGSIAAPDGPSREPSTDEPVLRGKVISEDGRPVADARVEWMALQAEDIERTPAWPAGGWGVPQRRSQLTRTDPRGEFVFPDAPDRDLSFGSAVVVLHRNHFPGGLDLGANEGPHVPVIVLKPAEPVLVSVVDSANQPLSDVRVLHVGDSSAPTMFGRLLRDDAWTDQGGKSLMAPFLGEQAFWAEKEDLTSVPWQGSDPVGIQLVLAESFTIGGTLDVPDWTDWDPKYQGERRILVAGLTGNLWRPLARLRDVAPGAWGPMRVPLGDATRFQVRLEGVPIVPIEVTFERPSASSHRRIDFAAARGEELWFLVLNEAREPIPNAIVHVWWGALDRFTAPYVEGRTGADGIAYAGTFPAGKVRLRTTAVGYVECIEELHVPSPLEGLEITLKKGGRIVGTCSRDSVPVQDFQVIYWKASSPMQRACQQFLGRSDGSFTIENLAEGELFIHAGNADCPPGKPQTVRVYLDRDSRVDLELASPIRGGGRIVDAATGEPVPHAFVQPYSSGGVQRTFPWGPLVPVGLDGTFETDAFVPGMNVISVEAMGFGSMEARATATSSDFLDWGDIRLSRAQTLRLSLVDADGGRFKLSDLAVGTIGGHSVPEQAFSPGGIVEFTDFPAGDHTLNISYPDGSWTHLKLRLESGGDWTFDHKVSGSHVVRVLVKGLDGEAVTPPPYVILAATEPKSIFVTRMNVVSSEGDVTFEGVRSSQAQILVFDQAMSPLATKDVFLDDPVSEFDVVVGGVPLEIVVRDAEGAALAGVAITIRSSGGDEILAVGETSSGGVASLSGVADCRGQIDIRHGIAGWRFGVPIDASVRKQEFVLDARSTLELRLKDGDLPLADVATRIETASGITLSRARPSDESGLIRYPPLGQGSYRIVCRRSDCWTTVVERTLGGEEDVSLDVQMRRLAVLDLTVLANGLPVTGVDVGLRSVEFDTDVRDWLEQGSIRAPDGLTTGPQGSVHVEGLPRGAYAWSVQLGDRPQSGRLELVAGTANVETVYVSQ